MRWFTDKDTFYSNPIFYNIYDNEDNLGLIIYLSRCIWYRKIKSYIDNFYESYFQQTLWIIIENQKRLNLLLSIEDKHTSKFNSYSDNMFLYYNESILDKDLFHIFFDQLLPIKFVIRCRFVEWCKNNNFWKKIIDYALDNDFYVFENGKSINGFNDIHNISDCYISLKPYSEIYYGEKLRYNINT